MAIQELDDPLELFRRWYEEAQQTEAIAEPTAMTLATATRAGRPSARVVLLKGYDQRGFSFYTNLASRKARELMENPWAALCFYWMPLDKQIRIEGAIEPVSLEEADSYFATRPKQSQLGAWASKQSQPLQGRLALERRLAKYVARYGLTTVPRPEFWSGYRLIPDRLEFWLKQPYRLHDRVEYTRLDAVWNRQRLYP